MTIEAETLLIQVRDELRDTREPFLVSDSQIYRALTQAQNELARDALCFTQTRGLSYAVAADQAWVEVDESIIRPRSITLGVTGEQVEPVTVMELESVLAMPDYGVMTRPDWRTLTDRTPRYAVTDLENQAWRMVPIPTESVTLNVTAWYYPDPLESGGESPLSFHDSEALVHGAVMALLMLPDSELYDAKKAEHHQIMWVSCLSRIRADTKRHVRPSRYLQQQRGYW